VRWFVHLCFEEFCGYVQEKDICNIKGMSKHVSAGELIYERICERFAAIEGNEKSRARDLKIFD
jgi:hypothetical protein